MNPSVVGHALSRRRLLAAGAAALLCARPSGSADASSADPRYQRMDAGRFFVPTVNLSRIGKAFLRTEVEYASAEDPGTIIVDPDHHFLYRIEGGGRATRFGVSVGREGYGWSGEAVVHDKQEWPDWYPPKDMLQRQPELLRVVRRLRGGLGMPGGPRNPLGARALYLWQDGRDTLYRIHGTVEPWSIGHDASSGCIRMIDQDVLLLYGETPAGTKVVVLPSTNEAAGALGDPNFYLPNDLVRDPGRLLERGLY